MYNLPRVRVECGSRGSDTSGLIKRKLVDISVTSPFHFRIRFLTNFTGTIKEQFQVEGNVVTVFVNDFIYYRTNKKCNLIK